MVHYLRGTSSDRVAGNAMVGTGAPLEGILLIKMDVTAVTLSSLDGCVLMQKSCNLHKATVTQP